MSAPIRDLTVGDNNLQETDDNHEKRKGSSKEGQGGDSQLIDARIKELSDWRGETLARIRKLIHEADPDVVEEVKWRKPSIGFGVRVAGLPAWSWPDSPARRMRWSYL